jgi:hypothetical protein
MGAFGWALGMRFPREIRGFSFVRTGRFISLAIIPISNLSVSRTSRFIRTGRMIIKTIFGEEKLSTLVDETETSLQLLRSWLY